MSETNTKKVKSSDLELKDKLVALNRVTKVTKGAQKPGLFQIPAGYNKFERN